jgi:hypothetical protein
MLSTEQLTEFFGWAAVVNITYLTLATLLLASMKKWVLSIHSKLFDLDQQQISSKHFDFLSNYKVATLVFTVAPYVALKIMGH